MREPNPPTAPAIDSAAEGMQNLDLPLERDVFLRTLIGELSGTLQEVVGLEEASGFVSVVGQRVGEVLDAEYRRALHLPHLNQAQVTAVLIDLKRRIQGDFYVLHEDGEKIVFGNRRCPFAEKVIGRPALCMMTSNVFGAIASQNLGYAKVQLQRTIARGDNECQVTVYLRPSAQSEEVEGREYVRG